MYKPQADSQAGSIHVDRHCHTDRQIDRVGERSAGSAKNRSVAPVRYRHTQCMLASVFGAGCFPSSLCFLNEFFKLDQAIRLQLYCCTVHVNDLACMTHLITAKI